MAKTKEWRGQLAAYIKDMAIAIYENADRTVENMPDDCTGMTITLDFPAGGVPLFTIEHSHFARSRKTYKLEEVT